MSKRVICLASVVGILVSGCVGIKTTQIQESLLADEVLSVGSAKPQPSDDAVYFILTAEMAGQRGQYEAALDNYLKAAKLTQDVKVLQRATQIALYLKKTDKALESASQWLQRDPGNIEARRLTALLLFKAGRTDEAIEQLTILVNMPGVDLENTLVDLAKLMGTEMSKEDAAKLMRRLSERLPRMAEVHFVSAMLAADRGEFPMALAENEKALALRPDWSRARLLQAQLMLKSGHSQQAREVMQKAVQSEPNNPRLRLVYAQFLAKNGNLAGAVKELEKILLKHPDNEDAMLGLAMARLEQGQEAKARQLFEELTESPNRRMQAYFYLGLLEARKNRLENALVWFDKVTEGPVAFDAEVNAITAMVGLGQISEARQRLADARKEFPQEALRLYLLEGELLTKSKDNAAAFDALSQGLVDMPGQPELLYTRALVAEQLDRLDVLEADLRAVLEKNPDDANALNALGFTLADRSLRLDEAKRLIARALELKPGDPAILDSYGWVLYRLGDNPGALDYLRRAYDAAKDPEMGAHLGEVLWESGKRQDAKKIWMESLRNGRDHKDIKKIMARYPEAFE